MNIFNSNSLLDILSIDNSIPKRDSITFSNNEIEDFKKVFNKVNEKNQDKNASKSILDSEDFSLKENDIVIVDFDSDDCNNLVSLIEKIQLALEENSGIRNNLINIIEESMSLDELEEKMASLAAEFNVSIKYLTELLPNNESNYMDLENVDVSHTFNNTSELLPNNESNYMDLENVDVSHTFNNTSELLSNNPSENSLSLNEETIENFINLLGNKDSFEEDVDVYKIIKKLQTLTQSNESILSGVADKKKDVALTFDNLNTNVIHNQIMSVSTSLTASNAIDYTSNTFANNLINIINNKIMNSDLSSGETLEVRLKLYPSNLGTLVVDIAQIGDKIHLKVVTENTNVKNFLIESIKDLTNSLNANNVDVGDVSVFVGSGSQSSSDGQSKQESFNRMTLKYDNDNDINDTSISKIKEVSTSRNLDIHI